MAGRRIRTVVAAVAAGVALAGAAALPAAASTPSSCRKTAWIEQDSSNPSYLVGWKYLRSFVSTSAGYPQVYYVYQELRPLPRYPVGVTWTPVRDVNKRC